MNEPNKEYPLMVISDYPANVDVKDGTVFESAKERLIIGVFRDVLKADFEDIYFTYLVKCRPDDDNAPGRESRDACSYYLYEEIKKVNPKVIVLLGNTVKSEFILEDIPLKDVRGEFIEVDVEGDTRIVLPTYSPGFIERQDLLLKIFAEDLQKAYNRAIDLPMDKKYVPTTICRTMDEVRFVFDSIKKTGVFCFDFETTGINTFDDNFKATGLSISFQIGHAYFIPLFHFESPFIVTGEPVLTFDEFNIQFIFDMLAEVMSDVKIRKIAQNLKFDSHVCVRYGITLFRGRFDDTMLQHYLLDENSGHGLKDMVRLYFPQYADYEEEVQKYSWDKVPLEILANYSGTDADLTHRLSIYFESELLKDERLYLKYRNVVMPVFWVLLWAEEEGFLINREGMEAALSETVQKMKELEDEMFNIRQVKKFIEQEREIYNNSQIVKLKEEILELEQKESSGSKRAIENRQEKISEIKAGSLDMYTGLNLRSVPQLKRLMYESHGFNFTPVKDLKTKKLQYGTDVHIISEIKDKSGFIGKLLLYRRLEKMRGTYFEGILSRLDKNDRLHGSLLQHTTVTGRLSSVSPNLQNLPNVARLTDELEIYIVGLVKKNFIPPEGQYIFQMDYSQLELRLIAEFAKEETMIDAYRHDKDLHTITGARLLNMEYDELLKQPKDFIKRARTNAKAANFGIVYGQMPPGFMVYAKQNYHIDMSLDEAKRIRKEFFTLYPKLLDWHETYKAKCKKYGYVRTFLGQKRRLPNIYSRDEYLVAEAERQSVNAPIQGTGGELNLFAMAILKNRLDPRVKLINNIHDSIMGYCPDDLFEETIEIMQETCENLPLKEYFHKEFKCVRLKVDFEMGKKSWGEMEEQKK